jgi:hypothetical protein
MSRIDHFFKHERRYVFVIVFVFLFITATISATSIVMEAIEDGEILPLWVPFVLEYSSFFALMILIPPLLKFDQRFPLTWSLFRRNIGWHVLASLVFSVSHIALMLGIRVPIFKLMGASYELESPLWELLYEYRKDAMVYVMFLAAIYAYKFIRSRLQGEASLIAEGENSVETIPERLLVRKLGKEFIVRVDDIEWLESSGNYVNLHIENRIYPLRTTLSTLISQLEPRGFRRIHRSLGVNLDFVASISPLESGDASVTLRSGKTLSLSRRYRTAFRQDLEV